MRTKRLVNAVDELSMKAIKAMLRQIADDFGGEPQLLLP